MRRPFQIRSIPKSSSGHDQVELLLDRERPQVAQQRRSALRRDVRLVLEDLPPVRRVAERGDDVAAERADLVGQEDDREQRDGREHEEQRGQQPAGPAQVELADVHAATVAVLGEQQRGDQVAADREEHVDAEEAARHPGDVGVVEQDRAHAERAQAVEPRHVAHPARRRRGLGDRVGTDGSGSARVTAPVAVCIAPILPHHGARLVISPELRVLRGRISRSPYDPPMDPAGYAPVADAIRERLAPGGGPAVLVGVAGSVCVGKSTTCDRLRRLLHPVTTEIVTTDGFLYPNAELERRGLTHEKGFPASYDVDALRGVPARAAGGLRRRAGAGVLPRELRRGPRCHARARRRRGGDRGGRQRVAVPRPARRRRVRRRTRRRRSSAGTPTGWSGCSRPRRRGRSTPQLGFDEAEQRAFADQVWSGINHRNLVEHILPTRDRAEIVIEKGPDHEVQRVRFAAGT